MKVLNLNSTSKVETVDIFIQLTPSLSTERYLSNFEQ